VRSGLGALGISVEGAHRSDLEMKSTSEKEYTLQYKPHEPGIYLLNIKFGDDHVTGTPRLLICIMISFSANTYRRIFFYRLLFKDIF